MTENDLSYEIRGAAFEVYNELGPGLLESVYQQAMFNELCLRSLNVKKEVPVPVTYKEEPLGLGFRLDLLVENKVIIEIKSVEELHKVHHKQLLNYLKLTNLKLGLLINFNTHNLKKNIYRKANKL